MLDGGLSEPGPSIVLSWIAPDGSFISDETAIEVSTPGDYVLQVLNLDNACENSDIVSVLPPPLMVDSLISSPDSCDLSNGSASVLLSDTAQMANYLWSNGDSTAAIFNLSASIYEVTVSAQNCEEIYSVTVDSITCVNIEEVELGLTNFKILPNPNSGNFQVNLSLSKSHVFEIGVVNVLGQNILELPLQQQFTPGSHTLNIDIENVADGIYFFQIKAGNSIFVRKIVKSTF